MFSPSPTDEFATNFHNNETIISNDLSEHDDDIGTLSNDNIVYATEDKSTESISEISYCGIKANSEFSAIINIAATAIGAGCLTFPCIISELGIFHSTFVFALVTAANYFSLDLLRSFVVDTKYFSFSLMTEGILGKKWLTVYSISTFIFYLSVNVNYLSLLYSIFKSSFTSHSSFYGYIFLLATCSIEIFLCLFTSKTAKINLFSLITMVSFSFIIFVVIVEGFHLSIKNEYIGEKFSKKYLLIPSYEEGGWNAFFASITGCIKYIYGYTFHVSFPTLIGNLKNLNDTNSKKVHNIGFSIIAGSYFIIGFFGYLMKKNVSTVIFREYEDSIQRDYFTITIKVILSIFLFSLIPNRYIAIRDGYTSLIGKDKLTHTKDLLITTLALILSNALVFMNEELFVEEGNIKLDIFTYMVKIFGGLFGVIICFFLPVINYTAINGYRKLKSIIGFGITGFFLIIGVFSFGYSLYEMFGGKNSDE